MSPAVIETLRTHCREHPDWRAQLHFDNLRVVLKDADSPLPSYPTIRRYLKTQAMSRQARPRPRQRRWQPEIAWRV